MVTPKGDAVELSHYEKQRASALVDLGSLYRFIAEAESRKKSRRALANSPACLRGAVAQ